MRICLFTFCILFSTLINAQDIQKISVAIPGFRTSNSSIKSETVSSIHQRVIDAFVGNTKFVVVERTQLAELQNEVNLQKTESFMDGAGNVSDKVKNTGAGYLVTGVISRLEYSQQTREKKEYNAETKKMVVVGTYLVYFCTIELNIKFIDVATSQIILSEIIVARNESGSSGGGLLNTLLSTPDNGANSTEEAYNKTLEDISLKSTALIRRAFPNVLTIAEITKKDRKGYADEILLVGDFTDGMGKKQELYVKLVTETMIAGKKLTRRKVIGTLKIVKVEEGGFISAIVRSGEDEITRAFEAKENIQITENQ